MGRLPQPGSGRPLNEGRTSLALASPRRLSWLLGLCSIVLPATLFAYYLRAFSNATAAATDSYICGMPVLGAMMFCLALAVALSLAALALALADYLRLRRPRPPMRLLEAIVTGGVSIALPIIVCVAWLLD